MDLPAIFRVWGFLKNPLGALLRRRRGHFCCFEVLKNYGVQVGAAPEQVPKKIKIKKMYYQKKLKPIFTRHTPESLRATGETPHQVEDPYRLPQVSRYARACFCRRLKKEFIILKRKQGLRSHSSGPRASLS